MHLHGVTLHFNTTRPLPCYFELGGPFTLRRRNLGSKCFVNTVLASLCYVGVAHMRCATPAQRYAAVREWYVKALCFHVVESLSNVFR